MAILSKKSNFAKATKNKTKKKEASSSAPTGKTTPYGKPSSLRQFWRSEKATDLSLNSQYVFLVSREATKPSVRREIETRYGVKVIAVNMILQKGKIKRLGSSLGRRSDFKKAIVTLKEGSKIESI